MSTVKAHYQEAVSVERAGNGAAERLNTSSPFESFFCLADERICSPPFMELTSACGEDTLQLIEKKGLAFPFSMYMGFSFVLLVGSEYCTCIPQDIANTVGVWISLPKNQGC